MDKMDKLLQGLAIANDINYDLNYIKGYCLSIITRKHIKLLKKQQMTYMYALINQI